MPLQNYKTIIRKAAKNLRPPPDYKLSEWSDNYSTMQAEDSAVSGRWKTSVAEYQRGIMDSYNEEGIEKIICMTSTQIGKTSILKNIFGYSVDNNPRPIMFVFPDLGIAKRFSRNRLSSYIRDTKKITDKFRSNKTKDSGNTILHKKFPGGHVLLVGASSPSGLSESPISLLLIDELDRWPLSAGNEGDPLELVLRRTSNFWNRKIFIFSTPTNQNSKINSEYEKSDKRKYFVSCPHCKKDILFLFKNLKWEVLKKGKKIWYECPECGEHIFEKQKKTLIEKGIWKATAKSYDGKTAGFWLNALYSPWISWNEIIDEFNKAKKNKNTLRVFINTFLAEIFDDYGDAPDHVHIYARREFYEQGTIPSDKILFLTASVDTQDDRFEVDVKGWTKNQESYLIEHLVFLNPTNDLNNYHVLDSVLEKVYIHPLGARMKIKALGIDVQGHSTQTVYMWVRRQDKTRVFALRGETLSMPIGQPRPTDINFGGQKITNGVRYWPIGVSHLKAELYAKLRLQPNKDGGFPFGYHHFPDLQEDYFKQLTAESLTTKIVNGIQKYYWTKHYERNEALDLNVYNLALVLILGIDRITEEGWKQVEAQLHVNAAPQVQHITQQINKPVRRTLNKGIDID